MLAGELDKLPYKQTIVAAKSTININVRMTLV